MDMQDKKFPVNRTATMGGVVLIDPATKKPYKAGVTVQQVDGGFDPTGLATDDKQDAILSALNDLISAVQANGSDGEVSIADEELPPVSGQATSAKQDSVLAALQNLAGVLGGTLTVDTDGPIEVTASSVPLASGASTATKQDAILAAVNALAEIFRTDTLDVSGSVDINGTVPVSGAVALTNASIAVTPSGAFTVDLPGSATSAKQDAILTALGNVLTAIQAPQVVTDGGQSITVDGVVGVSGTIPVSQSGTWTMQTTPGASATSSALTSFRSGTVSTSAQAIKASSGRVYQYTFFNPNAVTVYVHLYDAAVANVGTPKMSFAVPAGSTLDGYWSISHGFSTAISISASTNWDATGTPTSTMQVTVGYA